MEYGKLLKAGLTEAATNEQLPTRPASINNFEMLDLDSLYTTQLQGALTSQTQDWCTDFNDWNHMELKDALVPRQDFVTVSSVIWQKIATAFGGGPQVELFIVDKEPDFQPITLRALSPFGEEVGFLISN